MDIVEFIEDDSGLVAVTVIEIMKTMRRRIYELHSAATPTYRPEELVSSAWDSFSQS